MPTLTTRTLKCTVLIDPAELEGLAPVDGIPRVQLNIRTAEGSQTVTAEVAAKAVRKAQAVIAEHGTKKPLPDVPLHKRGFGVMDEDAP
jgi:hypothetical protein